VPPTIERINFLGGEPLMTNRHKDFLKLVSTPHTVNITYNTNGTFLLDDETYSLLKQFKNVKFIISIDGFRELNEKVRSGSKWEDVIKFIDQIKTLGFDIQIHSVLHINNWFGIVDLSKFINNNNLLWGLTVLTYPKHLDIINLTQEQKIEFISLLDKVDMNPEIIKIFPQTSNKEYIIKHLGILK
jgi:sulfatase maturation enzyme AslB (radical SAM superfamily)